MRIFCITALALGLSLLAQQGAWAATCQALHDGCVAQRVPADACARWLNKAKQTGVWDSYPGPGGVMVPAQRCTK